LEAKPPIGRRLTKGISGVAWPVEKTDVPKGISGKRQWKKNEKKISKEGAKNKKQSASKGGLHGKIG